jgi:hypothetical protein
MGPKLLRRSVSLLAVALCIYSCESGSVFKPRPRGRLWVYEPGIPEKESSLLQVRSLSRDLKHCSGRKDKYVTVPGSSITLKESGSQASLQ